LHIQTAIVDLVPEKENIVTTRLVVQSDEVGCLGGRDGALSDIQKMSGADVHILPKEELPSCLSDTDEIVQVCPYSNFTLQLRAHTHLLHLYL